MKSTVAVLVLTSLSFTAYGSAVIKERAADGAYTTPVVSANTAVTTNPSPTSPSDNKRPGTNQGGTAPSGTNQPGTKPGGTCPLGPYYGCFPTPTPAVPTPYGDAPNIGPGYGLPKLARAQNKPNMFKRA